MRTLLFYFKEYVKESLLARYIVIIIYFYLLGCLFVYK